MGAACAFRYSLGTPPTVGDPSSLWRPPAGGFAQTNIQSAARVQDELPCTSRLSPMTLDLASHGNGLLREVQSTEHRVLQPSHETQLSRTRGLSGRIGTLRRLPCWRLSAYRSPTGLIVTEFAALHVTASLPPLLSVTQLRSLRLRHACYFTKHVY